MIGQKKLKARIKKQIADGTFPRFSILVGPDGSGKSLLACWVAQLLSDIVVPNVDIKIDSIREIIRQAYKVSGTTVYIIPNADKMSVAAKNALLKVTEEPPNKAYFIMTLEDINNTLDTIKSRGTVYFMDRYTPEEIEECIWKVCGKPDGTDAYKKADEIIRSVCETPGEVETIVKSKVLDFYDYVKLVFDNIASVSTANAFKIPSKVSTKDGVDGYDLRLFWKMFGYICIETVRGTDATNDIITDMTTAIMITSQALRKLNIRGINKQALIDKWILDIRNAWSE